MDIQYIQLGNGDPMPAETPPAPYRAVIIVDQEVSGDWQWEVSEWLVMSGCLYMMAWGKYATTWDDSVDLANMAKYDNNDILDDGLVMTTWHDNETIDEVFWFCGHCAFDESQEFKVTLLVHITDTGNESEVIAKYKAAQQKVQADARKLAPLTHTVS